MKHDPTLDTLLFLDGVSFVVEADGACWVKFAVKRVPAAPEKPHGLDYSLTLHDSTGKRLLGFDNAHAVQTADQERGRGSNSITGTRASGSGSTPTRMPRPC